MFERENFDLLKFLFDGGIIGLQLEGSSQILMQSSGKVNTRS